MSYLGIDIGTTNVKVLLLSKEYQVLKEEHEEYPLYLLGFGLVEQDPNDWWTALCHTLNRLWASGIDSSTIKGICVSGHGCSLVVMDKNGKILRNTISCLDTRSHKQTEILRKNVAELVLKYNGNDIGTFNFEPKLLWLKENELENYNNMFQMLSATCYINYRLTKKWAGNVSDLGIGISYDQQSGKCWNEEIIQKSGLDKDKFPKLYHCSEIIGSVSPETSKETGLAENTPVLAGGEDTSSAALSVGVFEESQAYISMGTQATVGVCTKGFTSYPPILSFPHVISGLTLVSASMSTCGAGLKWFVDEIYAKNMKEKLHNRIYKKLNSDCLYSPKGAKGLLFLPYMSGELHPIMDEKTSGVLFGLKLEHTSVDIARSVMEGSAHAIAHNLSKIAALTENIKNIFIVGGPSQSEIWCQAIADITQKNICVTSVEGSSGGAPLGDALLALSVFENIPLKEILDKIIEIKKVYSPDPSCRELYQSYHEIYKKLYDNNIELFHKHYEIKDKKMAK